MSYDPAELALGILEIFVERKDDVSRIVAAFAPSQREDIKLLIDGFSLYGSKSEEDAFLGRREVEESKDLEERAKLKRWQKKTRGPGYWSEYNRQRRLSASEKKREKELAGARLRAKRQRERNKKKREQEQKLSAWKTKAETKRTVSELRSTLQGRRERHAEVERARYARATGKPSELTCKECGGKFTAKRRDAELCSMPCVQRHRYRRQKEKLREAEIAACPKLQRVEKRKAYRRKYMREWMRAKRAEQKGDMQLAIATVDAQSGLRDECSAEVGSTDDGGVRSRDAGQANDSARECG